MVIAFFGEPGAGRAALRRRLAGIDYTHRQHGLVSSGADTILRSVAVHTQDGTADPTLAGPGPGAVTWPEAAIARCSCFPPTDWAAALVGPCRRAIRGGHCLRVRALEEWLRASATCYGSVFRKVNRWGQVETAALGTDAIRLILARRTVVQ